MRERCGLHRVESLYVSVCIDSRLVSDIGLSDYSQCLPGTATSAPPSSVPPSSVPPTSVPPSSSPSSVSSSSSAPSSPSQTSVANVSPEWAAAYTKVHSKHGPVIQHTSLTDMYRLRQSLPRCLSRTRSISVPVS